ncbi:RNA polymerase factor sigma-54 [Alkanindiges sp. WGS2144]|uniref:RNA polymerase factor sigma-54 n=1 Tax=Alkanindiges sp. WGS2144 TaxID=3366808 RepID=UPI003752F2BE
MKLSMGMKVSTSLALTPQLQQAIRLLQLSSLELEQEVQAQLDSNPLLERLEAEDENDLNVLSAQSDLNQNKLNEEPEPACLTEQMQLTCLTEDLPVDTHWDDIFIHQPTTLAMPLLEDREDNRACQDTIWDHLRWQLNLAHFSPVDRLIAECIIDGIDERGYLAISLDDIQEAVLQQLAELDIWHGHADLQVLAQEVVELEEVEVVLKRIQHFEPAGVAARSLPECLTLQLKNLPEHTPYRLESLKLLAHHELLVASDIARLMRTTQMDQSTLQRALILIKELEPYPGQQFADPERDHQPPDVIVCRKNNRWEVQLNTEILPRLRINPYYASLIRRADSSSDNQYLRLHMQEGRNFIKSVDERHKTLLKVSSCIVMHQREFLEHGPEAMKPLVLRDIAEETELHESTVSRVTTQKYIHTPRGLFELKYFFSSHVGTSSGGECSSTAIRAMIKKIIQEENPRKPLSDNAITEKLQSSGIDVARRTVAKYRESLNIPSSSERKRLL